MKLQWMIIFTLFALLGCTSNADTVSYSEATKNYSCRDIDEELKYLDRLEKNLVKTKEESYAIAEAGAIILSMGLHALKSDDELTQNGQLNAEIKKIHENRQYMEALKNEKCPR